MPWSADFEPSYYSAVLRYSPDGKLLYVFGHEILIYDAATMVKVDAWDLSVPIESGMGRLDPGSFDESTDRPGFVTGVFTMRDALQNRNLLVVGQINLAARSIETFPLGPAPVGGDVSFTIAPDRSRAHVLHQQIGRHELWTIDMVGHRVLSRVPVPSRPRMQVRASSSGVREEVGLGTTLNAIIYDGVLKSEDTIVIGGKNGPIQTKIRALLMPQPLDEIRDPRRGVTQYWKYLQQLE